MVLTDDGGALPVGWRRERWTHSNWWIAGSVTMMLGYGLTVLVGYAPCHAAGQCSEAIIPLLGPMFVIANTARLASPDAFGVTTMIVTGLAQLAGTALIVAGLVVPRRVFVPVIPTLRITPVATAGGNGAEYVVGLGAVW